MICATTRQKVEAPEVTLRSHEDFQILPLPTGWQCDNGGGAYGCLGQGLELGGDKAMTGVALFLPSRANGGGVFPAQAESWFWFHSSRESIWAAVT